MSNDRIIFRLLPLLLLIAACDAADGVQVQELPPLERSSLEARLGLPEVRGAWRFAGWELQEGDTLGLDAELPAYGILWLQTQKRDSLGGFYVTSGGRAPLYGEARRNGVLSLVAFPAPGDGRYLVGEVSGDTLWVESTSLSEAESWRDGARVAFVRSTQPVASFRRVRGALPPPPRVDSAALAALDSAGMARRDSGTAISPAPPGAAGAGGVSAPARPPAGAPPATRPSAAPPPAAQPRVTPPPVDAEPEEEEPVQEAEPVVEPEPEPVQEPEPPRVLGVPVDRDD